MAMIPEHNIISVVIPAYHMMGKGIYYLERALASIPPGCEIIVSEDGNKEEFKALCDNALVVYVKNQHKQGAAANLNNAIDHAKGDIIKVLFQDDELGPLDAFYRLHTWGFCTSKHNTERGDYKPKHNDNLFELAKGNNTYGSPTALAFRRTELRFDDNLKWLFDCDFYARMTMKYGLPEIIDTYVKITEWEGQATYTVCDGQWRYSGSRQPLAYVGF